MFEGGKQALPWLSSFGVGVENTAPEGQVKERERVLRAKEDLETSDGVTSR